MRYSFSSVEKRLIITVFFCMAFTISNLITVKLIDLSFIEFFIKIPFDPVVPAGICFN